MIVRPFVDVDDLVNIHPIEGTRIPSIETCTALAKLPYSWVAFEREVIGVFGAIPIGKGYFRCWAFLDQGATKRQLYNLFCWIQTFIENALFRRLEITVREDFDAGLSWATRLGFRIEGLMEKYDEAGNNHCLLARCNDVW